MVSGSQLARHESTGTMESGPEVKNAAPIRVSVEPKNVDYDDQAANCQTSLASLEVSNQLKLSEQS